MENMRRPRIKATGEGFYHVVSWTGDHWCWMGEEKKGIFMLPVRQRIVSIHATLFWRRD